MKMIKKVLNKIAYIFICINQDIKMRYEVEKDAEDLLEEKVRSSFHAQAQMKCYILIWNLTNVTGNV